MKRATRLADRPQSPRRQGGLTGRTEDERRAIAERIEAASRAKYAAEGRTLTPYEIASAITPTIARERKCSLCGSKLPETEEHFYYYHTRRRYYSECKTCYLAGRARYYRSPAGRANREARRERLREASRKYMARIRAERIASGLPARGVPGAREKLMCTLRVYRCRLKGIADPARAERYRASIANLVVEIDRLSARRACEG